MDAKSAAAGPSSLPGKKVTVLGEVMARARIKRVGLKFAAPALAAGQKKASTVENHWSGESSYAFLLPPMVHFVSPVVSPDGTVSYK